MGQIRCGEVEFSGYTYRRARRPAAMAIESPIAWDKHPFRQSDVDTFKLVRGSSIDFLVAI